MATTQAFSPLLTDLPSEASSPDNTIYCKWPVPVLIIYAV